MSVLLHKALSPVTFALNSCLPLVCPYKQVKTIYRLFNLIWQYVQLPCLREDLISILRQMPGSGPQWIACLAHPVGSRNQRTRYAVSTVPCSRQSRNT